LRPQLGNKRRQFYCVCVCGCCICVFQDFCCVCVYGCCTWVFRDIFVAQLRLELPLKQGPFLAVYTLFRYKLRNRFISKRLLVKNSFLYLVSFFKKIGPFFAQKGHLFQTFAPFFQNMNFEKYVLVILRGASTLDKTMLKMKIFGINIFLLCLVSVPAGGSFLVKILKFLVTFWSLF